jgi:hypothetical protein
MRIGTCINCHMALICGATPSFRSVICSASFHNARYAAVDNARQSRKHSVDARHGCMSDGGCAISMTCMCYTRNQSHADLRIAMVISAG